VPYIRDNGRPEYKVCFTKVPNRVGDSLDDSKKFERATQHRHPRPGGDGDGLRVFYRRCRRFFGSGGRIDNVCGSSRRRSWTRRWLGSWSRTRLGPWSRLGPRPGLGLHRAWLLLQPALGPHDLPVLIADQVIKHRRVRRFAGAPFLLSTTDSKAKRFDRWSNTWIPIERHPNPAPVNQAALIASLGTHEANDATFHNRHAT
jgi:hypothetical protein